MKNLLYTFFVFTSISAFSYDRTSISGENQKIEMTDTTKSQRKIPISNKDYDNQKIEMADTMRSEGKIYVLVGIILIILLGLIGYTTHIDRKLSKLEKEQSN